MSLKSKDLHFDSAQPAFLQRLRGQLAGDDSGRHQHPVARNKKQKQDDDEDAPTYVLEDTNDSLTKAEYDAMVAGKDGEESDTSKLAVEAKKDNIAEVGKVSKKRKVAKVIGDENDGDATGDAKAPEKKVVKKVKKKGKPVKLSFGDEDEEG